MKFSVTANSTKKEHLGSKLIVGHNLTSCDKSFYTWGLNTVHQGVVTEENVHGSTKL